MSARTCQMTTGSTTDCRPLCDRPATTEIIYSIACYGEMSALTCQEHHTAMLGAIRPHRVLYEVPANQTAAVR